VREGGGGGQQARVKHRLNPDRKLSSRASSMSGEGVKASLIVSETYSIITIP